MIDNQKDLILALGQCVEQVEISSEIKKLCVTVMSAGMWYLNIGVFCSGIGLFFFSFDKVKNIGIMFWVISAFFNFCFIFQAIIIKKNELFKLIYNKYKIRKILFD